MSLSTSPGARSPRTATPAADAGTAAAPVPDTGSAAPNAPGTRPDRLQTVVALALLALFAAALVVLATMRDDPHWDRLVYLLTGFEAVVFAAVGAFFGVTVQRGAVAAARRAADEAGARAAEARADARLQRERGEAARQDATAGRALAAAVLAARDRTAAGRSGDGAAAELGELAEALFRDPDRR
ncbi:hypothetical protein GCM10010124_40980 [Pilimelia terevasa]|uniref:Uncharacterized protein n=1 Tax=Pilimelia terevasa TaxID=53372 RepID=A0A8J3FJY5_9ACTN|nr:hypothetical protein [Pilimelia terevasa]GGK43933.1 hypothetical protein GCM10010124_40980 [Pilimelia terevasa]